MSDGIAISATTTPVVQDKRAAGLPESSEAAEPGEEFAAVLEAYATAETEVAAATIDPVAANPAALLPPEATMPAREPARDAAGRGAGEVGAAVRSARERAARGAADASVTARAEREVELVEETRATAPPATDVPALPVEDAGALVPAVRNAVAAGDSPPPATSALAGASRAPEAAEGAAPLPRERPAPLAIDARLPVHRPEFGERFAQQMTVLVQHGIQHAHISVSPPELGPVDVRIAIQHDEATVQLASPSVVARDAMQEALPRLRELLEQAGVRLNDAGVYADLPQGGPHGGDLAQERAAERVNGGAPGERGAEEEPMAAPARVQVGLIDAYV